MSGPARNSTRSRRPPFHFPTDYQQPFIQESNSKTASKERKKAAKQSVQLEQLACVLVEFVNSVNQKCNLAIARKNQLIKKSCEKQKNSSGKNIIVLNQSKEPVIKRSTRIKEKQLMSSPQPIRSNDVHNETSDEKSQVKLKKDDPISTVTSTKQVQMMENQVQVVKKKKIRYKAVFRDSQPYQQPSQKNQQKQMKPRQKQSAQQPQINMQQTQSQPDETEKMFQKANTYHLLIAYNIFVKNLFQRSANPQQPINQRVDPVFEAKKYKRQYKQKMQKLKEQKQKIRKQETAREDMEKPCHSIQKTGKQKGQKNQGNMERRNKNQQKLQVKSQQQIKVQQKPEQVQRQQQGNKLEVLMILDKRYDI